MSLTDTPSALMPYDKAGVFNANIISKAGSFSLLECSFVGGCENQNGDYADIAHWSNGVVGLVELSRFKKKIY